MVSFWGNWKKRVLTSREDGIQNWSSYLSWSVRPKNKLGSRIIWTLRTRGWKIKIETTPVVIGALRITETYLHDLHPFNGPFFMTSPFSAVSKSCDPPSVSTPPPPLLISDKSLIQIISPFLICPINSMENLSRDLNFKPLAPSFLWPLKETNLGVA